jgi:hypothetical protein
MSKPVFGLLLGGILGVFDGLTAILTPEALDHKGALAEIVVGSSFKGIIAGVIMGLVARKFHSLPLGIAVGLIVGLVLAFLVAYMQPAGKHFYFQIMLPGSLVGLIVGFATQKYGQAPTLTTNAR